MAGTTRRTKPTATPHQASAEKTRDAEGAKPAKAAARKGIELVAEIEKPKKAKTAATRTTLKKEKVVVISQPGIVSREMIEQVAYQLWLQRGRQHGNALEDWVKAEQELRGRAS